MEATATGRLRKLDALFAERVLGLQLHQQEHCEPLIELPAQPMFLTQVPTYTRSLDAAWEGLPKQYVVSIHHRGDTFTCYRDNALMTQLFEDTAAHPAEALVLACLRAVGVSEEELS